MPGSPRSTRSWVDSPSRPGFAGFFHLPVFCLTPDQFSHRATESRVNLLGWSEFNNYGLVNMINIRKGNKS